MSLFLRFVEEDGTYAITSAGYGMLVLLFVALLILACFFTGKDNKKHFSTKQLVFAAICVTIATVTSMLPIYHLPMGGSLTLFSMFFITYVGYLYGLRAGITSALAYGLLQLILGPYIISIPQLICDYILAFGALGLSGLFSNRKYGMLKGYLVGVLGRYLFAVLSGVIFFGQYAADFNMSPLAYSLVYNIIYIGSETILTVILISVPAIRSALGRIKVMANEEEVHKAIA